MFASRPFGRRRALLLSLDGPFVVSVLVLVWAVVLTVSAALIIQPRLGTAVTRNGNPTPRDFISALYAGGTSMTLTGSSDYNPQTRRRLHSRCLTSWGRRFAGSSSSSRCPSRWPVSRCAAITAALDTRT